MCIDLAILVVGHLLCHLVLGVMHQIKNNHILIKRIKKKKNNVQMEGKIKSQKLLTDPPLSQELSFKNKAQI